MTSVQYIAAERRFEPELKSARWRAMILDIIDMDDGDEPILWVCFEVYR